jgi:hypothetical protein
MKDHKMKYVMLFAVLFFSLPVFAQNCSDESLLQQPGIWKERSGVLSGLSTSDLAQEKK